MISIRRVAHPTDFSPASLKALAWAIGYAKQNQAELLLIHVLPAPTPIFEVETLFRPKVESLMAGLMVKAQQENIRAKRLLLKGTGAIDKQILRAARITRSDLIVMSTRGRSGISRLFTGSVASRVIGRSHCPVVVVPYR